MFRNICVWFFLFGAPRPACSSFPPLSCAGKGAQPLPARRARACVCVLCERNLSSAEPRSAGRPAAGGNKGHDQGTQETKMVECHALCTTAVHQARRGGSKAQLSSRTEAVHFSCKSCALKDNARIKNKLKPEDGTSRRGKHTPHATSCGLQRTQLASQQEERQMGSEQLLEQARRRRQWAARERACVHEQTCT